MAEGRQDERKWYGDKTYDWSKPIKRDVFTGIPFSYEGWFPERFYEKWRNIVEDMGYLVYEYRTVWVPAQQLGGVNFFYTRCQASKEFDWKYEMTYFNCNMGFKYAMKPKPGTDPKKPEHASYGTANFVLKGELVTDWRNVWSGSAVLRLLRPIKEKYIYYDKIELFAKSLRNDLKRTLDEFKEYGNYLPTLL